MIYFRQFFVAACLFLLSCNDDIEKSDQPIIVFSETLYSFKPSENVIASSIDLGVSPYLGSRSGDELFILSYPYKVPPLSLHVINRSNFSVKRSKLYNPPSGEASAFTVADKIYIYDFDHSKGGAFISTVNSESLEADDTVFTNTPSYAQDLLVVGNSVFLSLGNEIKILDGITFGEIKTIDISNPVFSTWYSKFVLDKDNNVLIYNGGVLKLSTKDFTMKTLRRPDAHVFGDIKRPAYNAHEEALYLLTEIYESGTINYAVRRFDLNLREEENFVTNPTDISFEIHFISYNTENQLVVIGGRNSAGGIVKTFDTKGVFQKEYFLPNTALNAY
jgi:hypothetical protein